MPKPTYEYVRVTVATPDNKVLEAFEVCHWRSPDAGSFSDEENVGSRASRALLADRIEKYVQEHTEAAR